MAVKYAGNKNTRQHKKTPRALIDLQEASRKGSSNKAKTKGSPGSPQNLSMAWDDNYTGVSGVQVREGLMSERDKKDTYYQAYIGNTWINAAVDVIAKRFTSGGWEVEAMAQGQGNEANREKIKGLLLFVNEDEDFLQHLRSIATDLLIYGEAFDEIVMQNGVPVQLHKIDCCTMSVQFDKHGMVKKYVQTLDKSNETVEFAPEEIIRWWLPDARASKKALSPIERIKDATYLYTNMTNWAEKFFKQGARPSYSIELAEESSIDDANRFIKFFKENYTGIQNAHVPPVNYGGSKLIESSKGSVEMDFLKGRADCRDEILAGYNVPISMVGVQESAHLGSGTGESANKAFVYNVVKPIEQLILEKLNFRVVQQGFGIYDYMVTVRHADYRSDDMISKIQDTKIRNGSLTVNEARGEDGKLPVSGGDEAVIVASRDILPVQRLADLADEQRTQTQLTIDQAQLGVEKTKKTLEEPPPVQGNPAQAGQQQKGNPDEGNPPSTPQGGTTQKESAPQNTRASYAPYGTYSSHARHNALTPYGAYTSHDRPSSEDWPLGVDADANDFFVKAADSGGVPHQRR